MDSEPRPARRSDPLWLFRARLTGATDAPPPGRRRRLEQFAA
jgi:hypothetical protein